MKEKKTVFNLKVCFLKTLCIFPPDKYLYMQNPKPGFGELTTSFEHTDTSSRQPRISLFFHAGLIPDLWLVPMGSKTHLEIVIALNARLQGSIFFKGRVKICALF